MDSPYELLAALAFLMAVLAVVMYRMIGESRELRQQVRNLRGDVKRLQTGGGKTAGVTRLERRRSS